MPLPLPNLDDHDYAELVEMARSLIPSECPEWTDHNPSDTGIILLEMFAWLTDLLLYQVNQVPDASQEVFLQLLKGDATFKVQQNGGNIDTQALQTATQETILALRQRYRAVTAQDYEALVMQDWTNPEMRSQPEKESEKDLVKQLNNLNITIGRVKAFENMNLTLKPSQDQKAVGHISLVMIPQNAQKQPVSLNPEPQESLKKAIEAVLEERRLLGTKHHVVSPAYVPVSISAQLYLEPGRVVDDVKAACLTQLTQFFHPLSGGEDGQGWPFGRAVYVSEIYQQLDQVEGVDYVENIIVKIKLPDETDFQLLKSNYQWQVHQLIQFDQVQSTFTVQEVR